MSDLRTAAQQALEALEQLVVERSHEAMDAGDDAITALRAALEQPEREQEQEPVAHVKVRPLQGDEWQRKVEITWVGGPFTGPLYTHPPRREWRSLSEEEIAEEAGTSKELRDLVGIIEAALKERNA